MEDVGKPVAIAWAHGVVSVEPMGAMLGPTLFVLPGAQQVAPFHIAPWAHERLADDVPPILRHLRGEWPCVPFGSDGDRPQSGEWPASAASSTLDPWPHGFGSSHRWDLARPGDGSITASIAYPDGHPIRAMVRKVTPDPEGPALDVSLSIEIRADCRLPIGLHPTLRLPIRPGAMRVEVEPTVRGMTFPGPVDASSIFQQGMLLERWNEVPIVGGGTVDASRLPLSQDTEDLIQLLDMTGEASLWNGAEGYRIRINWNPEHFPNALVWISNRGRRFSPWNGRHLALGFEPVCSAFDLGQQISAADNPIARLGIPTARPMLAGECFTTQYRIAVEPAETAQSDPDRP